MFCFYGMKERPAGIGCQPKGLVDIVENMTPEHEAKYYDVVEYDRELTQEEVEHYSMEFIACTN